MRALFSVAIAALIMLPAAAEAAFPGANGKIAFGEAGRIYTINPDGTGRIERAQGGYPAWSPDGRKIAYINPAGNLATMNADGSGQTDLGVSPGFGGPGFYIRLTNPAWSPDGTQIAFVQDEEYGDGIFAAEIEAVNSDGSGRRHLYSGGGLGFEMRPRWSPNGEWIAFDDYCDPPDDPAIAICRIHPDGTGLSPVFVGSTDSFMPDWSPDGSSIAFGYGGGDWIARVGSDGGGFQTLRQGDSGAYGPPVSAWSPDGSKIAFWLSANLYVMNADGSGATLLTSGYGPDWQPIPQSYARPRGASPLRASLVPSYAQCTSPDNSHGAPLSFPSCSIPAGRSESPYVTTGTPDANGAGANMQAAVLLKVRPGNSSTLADEADVAIDATIPDVRCPHGQDAPYCSNINAPSELANARDYAGELEVRFMLRLTDRDNTPNPGGPGPGTVGDTPFGFTVPCQATDSTTIGSTCQLTTSADTIVPGVVKEGLRSIWALDQVNVYDGGADGDVDTAGNSRFLTEGVFVP